MKHLIILAVLLVVLPQPVFAGGGTFKAKIKSIEQVSPNEYRAELIQFSVPYSPKKIEPKEITVFLKHRMRVFPRKYAPTLEEFRKCIAARWKYFGSKFRLYGLG